MQLEIESPHMEANEALQNFIKNKVAFLGKKFSMIKSCDVILRSEKNNKQQSCFIEARMEVPGKTLFASDNADSFESAFLRLAENLKHQLNRYKEGLKDKI
ncbi:MAG TPA: ribosome-associated translation inhibitor RaiA [Puia sp.]|nr:ribosome-associated translation inhibitor RaiA [Puia sp.]